MNMIATATYKLTLDRYCIKYSRHHCYFAGWLRALRAQFEITGALNGYMTRIIIEVIEFARPQILDNEISHFKALRVRNWIFKHNSFGVFQKSPFWSKNGEYEGHMTKEVHHRTFVLESWKQACCETMHSVYTSWIWLRNSIFSKAMATGLDPWKAFLPWTICYRPSFFQ